MNQGQSLVEVLVALVIASLISVGLVKVATTAIKNSRYSSEQGQATALAQKKVAELVDQKNTDSATFWSFGSGSDFDGVFCLYWLTEELLGGVPAGRLAQIRVEVYWQQTNNLPSPSCTGDNFASKINLETYVAD